MKHNIINRLVKENDCKSYLEIGYGNGYNFNQIQVKDKVSVDTNGKATFNDGSDEFFVKNDKEFDCVFIDGLHHADQVRKDIINALRCNAKVICLHDTLPPTLDHQIVPRKQLSWTGDVWRAVVGFHNEYPDVKLETYKADYGLTVIYPEGKKVRKHFEDMEMTFEEFNENKVKLLNVID